MYCVEEILSQHVIGQEIRVVLKKKSYIRVGAFILSRTSQVDLSLILASGLILGVCVQ